MRTFALVVETKGNPAVSKKKPSEDDTILDQPVNGETVDEDTEPVDPTAESDEDFPLDDAEVSAEDDGLPAEGEEPVDGEEPPAEGDGDLPLDDMAAEEQGEPGEDALEPELDAEADPLDPEGVAAHEWAGDIVVDQNEITTPEGSFRTFTGAEGETAWLDRADDGTLTGWVQDADGTTYRYSDADAWAIDVDDAQMTAGGEELPLDEEMPLEEEPVEEEGAPIDSADPAAASKPPFEGKHLVAVRRLA